MQHPTPELLFRIRGIAHQALNATNEAYQRIVRVFQRPRQGKLHLQQGVQTNAPKKRKIIGKSERRKMARARTQRAIDRTIDENRDHFKTNFALFLQQNEQELLCPICRCHMVRPTLTPCQHCFCLTCIEKSLVTANKCPLCRQPVSSEHEYGLKQASGMASIIKCIDPDHDTQPTDDNRFPIEFKEGEKVDAWALGTKKWQHSTILHVDEDSITIEYRQVQRRQEQTIAKEVIDIPTLRIAKERTFTKQREPFLPRLFWEGWGSLSNGRGIIQPRQRVTTSIETLWNRPTALLRPRRNFAMRMIEPDSSNQEGPPSPPQLNSPPPFGPFTVVHAPDTPPPLPNPQNLFQDDSLVLLEPPSPEIEPLRVEEDRLPFLNPRQREHEVFAISDDDQI